MVLAALLMDLVFTSAGLVPANRTGIRNQVVHSRIDHTFALNLLFAALAVGLVILDRRHPVRMDHRG